MEQDAFVKTYFSLLAKKAAPFGYEPKPLTDAVWKGTAAMVQNDGSVPNCERFWQVFGDILGEKARLLRPEFDDFYAQEFHGARASTGEKGGAGPAGKGL